MILLKVHIIGKSNSFQITAIVLAAVYKQQAETHTNLCHSQSPRCKVSSTMLPRSLQVPVNKEVCLAREPSKLVQGVGRAIRLCSLLC